MLELIKRRTEYVDGYKGYCQEAYDHHIKYFLPTDPARSDAGWFAGTKEWYDKKEPGQVPGQPIGFHFWAVDGATFIGGFQLRTEFSAALLTGIGNTGYAVRVSQQGKGYGTEILKQGLAIARNHGMRKVLLNISDSNVISAHVCEKPGGKLRDQIRVTNPAEGSHIIRRYWITL